MRVHPTPLDGLVLVEPAVFHDERGYFTESFNRRVFNETLGLDVDFVQDNHSHSRQGVLRGLHYQLGQAQGKLVRVLRGRIFDVAVDLRQASPSFGRWFGVELSEDDPRQFWVPPGFAHGFLVLSESADVFYKVTAPYAPAQEHCIVWNDPQLGIAWPTGLSPTLSTRDAMGLPFAKAPSF